VIYQNDRLATATLEKKMPTNQQIVFVKNINTHNFFLVGGK
jgi:hypothetical protein